MKSHWHPAIDPDKCIECGTCIDTCPNNVYDEEMAPTPNVARPEDCADDCTECGEICPTDAIVYVDKETKVTSVSKDRK